VVVFQAKKTAKRKKGAGKNTVVDLHQDLMTYFAGLTVSENASAPIFPALSRRPVGSANGLSAGFRRLMDKAGIYAPVGAAKGENGRYRSIRCAMLSSLSFTVPGCLSRSARSWQDTVPM
jgi:hypothetical protein